MLSSRVAALLCAAKDDARTGGTQAHPLLNGHRQDFVDANRSRQAAPTRTSTQGNLFRRLLRHFQVAKATRSSFPAILIVDSAKLQAD